MYYLLLEFQIFVIYFLVFSLVYRNFEVKFSISEIDDEINIKNAIKIQVHYQFLNIF